MEKPDCINWQGKSKNGYGINNGFLAHRRAWEAVHGPVPSDMVIHHDCENTMCVNPDHLVAVTHSEHRRLHPRDCRAGSPIQRPQREFRPTDEEVLETIKANGGNKARAARELHVSRCTIYERLNKIEAKRASGRLK